MNKSFSGLTFLLTLLFFALISCKQSKKAVSVNENITTDEMNSSAKDSIKFIRTDNSFTPPAENDPFNIVSVNLSGDILEIEVSYSGGCEQHNFDLVFNGAYKKSLPAKADLYLLHDNNNDQCRSIVEKKLFFNILSLRFPPNKAGELHLYLNGWSTMIKYSYE